MATNRHIMIQLIVIVFLVAACGGDSEPLPTEVEFPDQSSPTETEAVEAQAEITEEPTSTPVINPTLPPTWTNTPEPSETPIPTATEIVDTATPLPEPETVASVCDAFAADPEGSTREFLPGEAPVASWTSIEGAELYRVFLSTRSGTLIRDDIYTAETTFTFDPNSFEFGEFYIWAVWPLDAIGDQMCFERGGELIPQRPPVGSGG